MPHVDLLELPYFEGLSMEELVSLVDLMEPARFGEGETIVVEGDPEPQPLFIATTGKLLVTKHGPQTEERTLAQLASPTLFGEIELFCQIPPVCSTKALSPVEAFTLTRTTFDKLFAAHNPALLLFTFNVARVACHRLAIADELLAEMLQLHGEDLLKMREAVWSRLGAGNDWSKTTGAFKMQPE